jgi:hypothetical protein
MPFEEDDSPIQAPKQGLKNVSSKKSIFESLPKKPSPEEFEKRVKDAQESNSGYKKRAAELALNFKKILEDKTLPQNKNIFANEFERELLVKMIQLAIEINNDPNEQEGMGSLGWITLLFKTILSQRDRINNLEYNISVLEKKLEPATLSKSITKELQALDKKKDNE